MILRIRSRDGTDRITVPDAASATVGDLQRLIAARVTVPVPLQHLSLDLALLLPPAATAAALPRLLSDPATRLASLNLPNGSFVYLSYSPDACSSQPPPPKGLSPAGSFSKKMTMDELIACQIRVTCIFWPGPIRIEPDSPVVASNTEDARACVLAKTHTIKQGEVGNLKIVNSGYASRQAP